jgi:transmembrane sensor
MKKKYKAEKLIYKYLRKSCSDEERAMVESWHIKDLSESTYLPSKENINLVNKRMANKLVLHIDNRRKFQRTSKLWQSFALIASVLFILSILTFLYLENTHFSRQTVAKNIEQHDVFPGGYKAILTLYDGKKIELHEKGLQTALWQNKVNISRRTAGELVYHNTSANKGTNVRNILETPRGGQYKLVLPDGTKVWLNSSSRLTYTILFTGKERQVKLIGEAYFEVAKDPSKPFKVFTSHQIVEVLGTHFNISAYPEENKDQTTLLEGKVKIHHKKSNRTMKPGQEAILNYKDHKIELHKADIEKNMAWKNDEFIFNGENLQSIMRSISRWYDVDIVFQNNGDQSKYWGTVSRKKNLSSVLKMLESTGKIKFQIKGRRIIAMN